VFGGSYSVLRLILIGMEFGSLVYYTCKNDSIAVMHYMIITIHIQNPYPYPYTSLATHMTFP